MSFEDTQAVWDRSRQKKASARLVLLAIANHTNKDMGYAWPSISTLGRKTLLSERSVQRHIRTLEQSGELQVFPNLGPKGVNLYKINLGKSESAEGDTSVTAVASGLKVVTDLGPNADSLVTQSANNPLLESTPIVPKGDKEFWIKVCFDCFNQNFHPLAKHVIRRLSRMIPILNKGDADSLLRFYRYKPFDAKPPPPPYNSRRYSPERLILDLPRQLALAIRACPPPPPKKEEPPRWREFFNWKYRGPVRLKSFYDLDRDLQDEYHREFEEFIVATENHQS